MKLVGVLRRVERHEILEWIPRVVEIDLCHA